MDTKKLLFGSLFVGGCLALTRLLFAKPASAKQAAIRTSYDAVDAYVVEQIHRLHIPGASLAIVKGKRIVYRRGFGVAGPGGETPSSQTPFFIGSLTKSITALAVMQLVEAGKVELDAPVQRYLPWYRVADPEASARMTVRHLLNQTSGLPLLSSEVAFDEYDTRPNALEHRVRALATEKLKLPPGAKWGYSNHNYNVLGMIIQAVSGESYSDYIRSHIFIPLHMSHSYTSKAEAQKNGLAMGYRHWFSLPFPAPNQLIPLGSLPSGHLISSAEDMAHYLIAHLNAGQYGDEQILSSAGIDEMHRGVKEVVMFGISGGFYGMGWFDIDVGNTKTYSHGGNVPDFSAFMSLIPGQKMGMVLLLNADPYGLPVVTEEIGMGVTALLAGQQPPPVKLDFIQWIFRLSPVIPLLQFVGVFATLRMLQHWERKPDLHPGTGRMWGQHILLPLIPNLTLSTLLVYLETSGLIRFLNLFMPDMAWVARFSGGFAAVWATLRTGLMLRVLRKPRP